MIKLLWLLGKQKSSFTYIPMQSFTVALAGPSSGIPNQG